MLRTCQEDVRVSDLSGTDVTVLESGLAGIVPVQLRHKVDLLLILSISEDGALRWYPVILRSKCSRAFAAMQCKSQRNRGSLQLD